MPLHVILLADEVPKEVPEVHPTHLVIREEPEVLPLRGHQFLEEVVQTAFGLQHLSHVVLVARLVGALGQATQVVFLGALLALQLLDIPLAMVEPAVQLVEDVPCETGPHLGVAERRRIHLAGLRIAHEQDAFVLHLEVFVKPLSIIREQPLQHALEFHLAHVGSQDVVLQMGLELRPRHVHFQERAAVIRR